MFKICFSNIEKTGAKFHRKMQQLSLKIDFLHISPSGKNFFRKKDR